MAHEELSQSFSLPLLEHSLNCMSNCIIKISIIKRDPEIGSVSSSAPAPVPVPAPANDVVAEVNRKITVEHDKRQCYQRNLINTAPLHLATPSFPSLSLSPRTLSTLHSLRKHSTILQNSTCENSTRNANENEANKRI